VWQTVRDVLTHEVVDEALPGAPIHQYDTPWIYVCDVHGRTLHLGIGKTHLHVDVVHIL
jgi:hypothetical protein